MARSRLHQIPAVLLVTAVAVVAQQAPNVSGIWVFTAAKFSDTIRITQNGTAIVGQSISSSGGLRPAFTGTLQTATTRKEDVIIYWDSTRADVPSVSSGAVYWGNITADASFMAGPYGRGRSEILGSWSGLRTAGLGPAIHDVRNAASGAAAAVAPGEVISVYANASTNPIGPAVGVGLKLDENGKVATALGGVRLLFQPIGVYAPLTYVGPGQINAVVPYEVAGLSSVGMQVSYQNELSNVFVMHVAAASPGVFTYNGSGTGQGAIVNHDGILNGTARPESRGNIIALYMTGEGQTNPAGVSGKVTVVSPVPPVTPAPVLQVSAAINGQPAQVVFYGEAPGIVSGVMQVNLQIPTTVSPGNVPIQVWVGGKAATQAGVTVAVQ